MVRITIAALAIAWVSIGVVQESKQTDKTADRLSRVKNYIDAAGAFYKQEKFSEAARQINAAQALLMAAAKDGGDHHRQQMEKEYKRISKAHELLADKQVKLSKLKPLPGAESDEEPGDQDESPEADGGDEDDEQKTSFAEHVAPILVEHCGSCHVRASRGEFSLATYEKLMQGGPSGEVIVAGKPDQSLLMELVVNGEMPPRGGEITRDEMDVIKAWIEEGAAFDGSDKKANISSRRPQRKRR